MTTGPDSVRGSAERAGAGLGARERDVLRSVIRAHIALGTPVGSKSISLEAGLDLSPATIRNIMAELEARGLLTQPHTSAGRVPTDIAYRLYVDQLMGTPRVGAASAQAIESLLRSRSGLPALLEEASRQLSRFSSHVGVVMGPEVRHIVVEHLEFVRLDAGRIVVVLVDRSGAVHNRILEETGPAQDELDRIGRFLTEHFAGMTLLEMRQELARRLKEDRAESDRLRRESLALGQRAVEGGVEQPEVFVEGASNLLASLDSTDLDRTRAVLKTLEEKARLVDLLGRVLDSDGVQVVIGHENPLATLADCSLVASPFRSGDRVLGMVGIVGPTRMEYARTIALVETLARVLTRLLTGPAARTQP